MEMRLISHLFIGFFALSAVAVIIILGISLSQSPERKSEIPSATAGSSTMESDAEQRAVMPEETQTPTPIPTPTPPAVLGDSTTPDQDEFAERLYALINGFRREQQLSPLNVKRALEVSARAKLYDMQQRNYWTHQDPAGNPPWQFFTTAGYDYLYAGENIATNHNSPWAVFSQWEQSSTHRSEMLKPEYADMGLGIDCQYQMGTSSSCVVVLHLGKHR